MIYRINTLATQLLDSAPFPSAPAQLASLPGQFLKRVLQHPDTPKREFASGSRRSAALRRRLPPSS